MIADPLFQWPDRATPRPVLCLDPARSLGWCAGIPGMRPEHGTIELRGRSQGALYGDLVRWMRELIRRHQPATLVVEAPLGESKGAGATRTAYGLAATLHMLAFEQGIAIAEEPAWRTRRAVMGRSGFAPEEAKAAVIAWCRAQGFAPANDDEADAILLFKQTEQEVYGRKAA